MPLQGKAAAKQNKKEEDEEEREQKELQQKGKFDSNGEEDNIEEVIRCHLHVAHLFQHWLSTPSQHSTNCLLTSGCQRHSPVQEEG